MAVSYNPRIVTDGLVLYLDAANPRSYPGNGTTWYDLSGRNNNGTLVNNSTFANINNGSILFNGSNNYVSLGNTTNFFSSSNITVCAIIRSNISGSYKKIIVDGSVSDSIHGLYLSIGPQPYPVYLGVRTTNGFAEASDNIYLPTDKFTYICGTYDGSFIKLYKNGILVATTNQTGNFHKTDGSLRISGYHSTSEIWNGYIANIKLYNKVLNNKEILENFSALRGRYGL